MTQPGLLQVAKQRLADLEIANAHNILQPLEAVLDGAPAGEVLKLEDDPGALGRYRWSLLTSDIRKSSGVYYTPARVAAELAGSAVRESMPSSVCDPAMGGGVFLQAVADAMVAQGSAPIDAFRALHGVDLDPVSVEVTRFCLGEWAWRHELGWLDAGDRLGVADSLLVDPWPVGPQDGFDLVIGNPPFAGQLLSVTAHPRDRVSQLKQRYGAAAQAYTDAAALFLLLGARLCRDQLLLVLPRSLLGVRDASEVRRLVAEKMELRELWLGSGEEFNANVHLCALRFSSDTRSAEVDIHSSFGGETERCAQGQWAQVGALAAGAPEVEIKSSRRLGQMAQITADFRDEYYALSEAVREDDGSPENVKLITSGLIDPAHNRWGETTCRFAKKHWQRPVVCRDLLPIGKQSWFDLRRGPKILVASQTSVIEPVADPLGELIPATPVVTVVAEQIWHVTALLCSPVATLALLYSTYGTAQGANALRVSAATLKDLPVPEASEHWDLAATLIAKAHSISGQARRDLVLEAGEAMIRAYGLSSQDALGVWWAGRLPQVR